MKNFSYETIKQDAKTGARAGILHTPHGDILTPTYMPVGTQATVKGVKPDDLKAAKTQIILSNTYHLYMRPGDELIKKAGGLHKFMAWDKPILTDSGGFQVFSLADLNKITDEGVHFNSHIDGSKHFITPEKAIDIENNLGADIIMAFDECSTFGATKEYSKTAMERTLKWLDRCYNHHKNEEQMLFPIVQGNVFKDLRLTSLRETVPYAKCGFGIGGLSVGEPKETMYDILDCMLPYYPENMPRYLMGVGSPDCLVEGVLRGVDLDPECDCYACTHYTKAYLRHLINAGEMMGGMMLSLHNITYLNKLMRDIREAILQDAFTEFREEFYAKTGNLYKRY